MENNQENQQGNTPNGEAKTNAQNQPNVQQSVGSDVENLKAQIDESNKKLKELEARYEGSSKEAIRLKDLNEKLEGKVRELESNKTQEVDISSIIEQGGDPFDIFNKVLEPIRNDLESLKKEKVEKIYNDFKQKHPGLKDEVLNNFNTEFERLKKVYSNVGDALEAAYKIVGGEKADDAFKNLNSQNNNQEDPNKREVLNNVKGDGFNGNTPPNNGSDALKKQIIDLTGQAMQLEAQGQNCEELWVKIETLKSKVPK